MKISVFGITPDFPLPLPATQVIFNGIFDNSGNFLTGPFADPQGSNAVNWSNPEPGTILGLLAVGALGAASRKRKG